MIDVRELTIDYQTSSGAVRAVDGINFSLAPSEILGLVGESGSGKSTVAMALVGHTAPAARVRKGEVLWNGHNLLTMPAPLIALYRGKRIGFVPQNSATGLSPHLRIGSQFAEVVMQHGLALTRNEALLLAKNQFALVGLPTPEKLLGRYPHELSGGQQQRVSIALAIACRPELLVLDEPTTGLDVTTQLRIVELLRDLRSRFGIGMLYVTHDLGLLSQIADRVGVMYAGRLIEIASNAQLFAGPLHPYSRGLIASVPGFETTGPRSRPLGGLLERRSLPSGCAFFPRCDHARPSCATTRQSLEPARVGHDVACQRWQSIESESTQPPADEMVGARSSASGHAPLVELESVSITYRRRSRLRRLFKPSDELVVSELSLSIREGEIFALVGESGSGKSTIARTLSGLLAPLAGSIRFRGMPLAGRLRERTLELKRQIQYVFQNPDASLNPRERVRRAVGRPLKLYYHVDWADLGMRVARALQEVRLDSSYADRFPDQLSGGERQRVAIARGLAAEPSLILCDEVLSALDVSVQASIIDLLARLRRETGVAMLFISHDLAVVRKLADRTGVLFRGSLVEIGPTERIFEPPYHPYTEELLLAVPSFRQRRSGAKQVPKSRNGTGSESRQGCVYAQRCPKYLGAVCDQQIPPWRPTAEGHAIRCHIPLSELASENPSAERFCSSDAHQEVSTCPQG
jgi:peptide/nickel transport system ATP-binding protein